ncbi:MAG: hypothetical protein FJ333_04505 [Sphingomonadales bacterium]|nr:hypothetical protein [Sphingomonadales bacterium]
MIWLRQISFYFSAKDHLVGTTIATNGIKKAWLGVTISIPNSAFENAFGIFFERSEKDVQLGD